MGCSVHVETPFVMSMGTPREDNSSEDIKAGEEMELPRELIKPSLESFDCFNVGATVGS